MAVAAGGGLETIFCKSSLLKVRLDPSFFVIFSNVLETPKNPYYLFHRR